MVLGVGWGSSWFGWLLRVDVGWLFPSLLQAFKPPIKPEAFGFPDDKFGMWWWLNQW